MSNKTSQPEELKPHKNRISKFFPEPILKPLRISLTISLVIFALSTWFYPKLQPEIPLFYSLADPSRQLVAKQWLFLLPVISLIICTIHLILIRTFAKLNELALFLFSWSTVMIEVIILMILLRIILIL
ncbi:MAG: hypothetical protein U9O78_00330 [Patescibacteria group bacterium]|nr:hypothetical protein [Patescibacteria group bacterium]